jgi:8-oxo-dGTP pyrophosphatase MutT (NUDIX family)
MTPPEVSPRFKVRVGVVWIDPEQGLLLLRQNDRPFWVLPGGTMEYGESITQCGQREMKEELGLDVTLGPLLSVADLTTASGHQVIDFVFFAHTVSGVIHGELTENINEIAYFSSAAFSDLPFKPEVLKHDILNTWLQNTDVVQPNLLSY